MKKSNNFNNLNKMIVSDLRLKYKIGLRKIRFEQNGG